jgi:4-alpha-glucanotransferase
MPALSALGDRRSGVLCHLTSLPGPYGCGDLGEEAHRFVEFLASAGQAWWQMLPVGPPGYGNAPYMASSAFAIAPFFLSLGWLYREGLLDRGDLEGYSAPRPGLVDYPAMSQFREERLRRASATFFGRRGQGRRAEFESFCAASAGWLADHALFAALKEETQQASWTAWEEGLRRRDPKALERARGRLSDAVRHHSFVQWALAQEWDALRRHGSSLGVGLIGDVPVFVAHESADVWANPGCFYLDREGQPTVVAGVPPDYFSVTGQRWGHPLYRWEELKKAEYGWWMARMRRTLDLFDVVRIDHFIGFQRYWEIPASCPTAVEGRWMAGPGADFFEVMLEKVGRAPIIAEDLGLVTEDVILLRERFGFPGMKVLQFAFGGDHRENVHLPHWYTRGTVAYTGTHDNDTTVGWFHSMEYPGEREFCLRYLNSDGREIHWDMIRAVHASAADLSVIPVQDVLGLGSEARMNRPSIATGNWEWRLPEGILGDAAGGRLRYLTDIYQRLPQEKQGPGT